jgi:hypothetical protein
MANAQSSEARYSSGMTLSGAASPQPCGDIGPSAPFSGSPEKAPSRIEMVKARIALPPRILSGARRRLREKAAYGRVADDQRDHDQGQAKS